MNTVTTQNSVCMTSNNGNVLPTTASSIPSNPVPTSMLSFRFATPNNTQTPYYISSDIVLSGGIAQQNRRRIVHNEVEKRRKDKITNWIKKLAELLPRHRVARQSKNYVLETACEYIEELNEMSTQFSQLKLSKESLEKEVTELRNKVNKLEDENKRLSQLIHENKVSLPTTWSDSSVITTTMRATSSSRNGNTQTSSALSTGMQGTTASTQALRTSDVTPTSSTSNITNRLSVTSILSSASNQQTTSNSRHKSNERLAAMGSISKSVVVSTQSSTTQRNNMYVPATSAVQTTAPISVTRTPDMHRRHNVTAVASGIALSQNSRSSHVSTAANDITKVTLATRTPTVNNGCNNVLQPLFVPQPQTGMVPSGTNATTVTQLAQTTAVGSPSFERGFTQVQQLRSNSVQDNISQLPYSIDALTGNQTSHNRQQSSGNSHLLNFSAESLIGRQPPSNDIVMISPVNQPVIQNTFTLTHRNTPANASVTTSSVAPQNFSNFSALSLVGSNDTLSSSTSSTTQTLTRSTSALPESATIPQPSNHMFTDFSTESLIGPSEFTSDFAIDNLISRSDSNAHMATINPNLIQSYGKGNDPMISSVSGDHSNHFPHNFDPTGLNMGRFSPHHYPPYW